MLSLRLSLPFLGLAAAVTVAACGSNVLTEGESVEQGLTDPTAPDLTVDAARLQASLKVVTNSSVTPAEVAAGCAPAATGRTLARFDVKTANLGPGALTLGRVTCTSKLTANGCAGADCSAKPQCCPDGQSTCLAAATRAGRAFTFDAAKQRPELTGFTQVRVLDAAGHAVASVPAHKQTVCIADVEDVTPGSCATAARFTCGDPGLHKGCADVAPAADACSFVDVTDLAPGDYTLEVTVDPLDLIDEANETNNVSTAKLHIDPPLFLVRKGVGVQADADAYYRLNAATGTTLATFRTQSLGTLPIVTGFYQNKNELGFWREMTCSKTIARGQGACIVTNWRDPTDKAAGRPNLGTVGMNVSADGFARFYVFVGADGVLSPSALLDAEGPKFLPQLCTNCHGGQWTGHAGAGGAADLGSVFREFEPSLLQLRPGITQAQAEQEWFNLNQAIRGANAAIRAEAQGAPANTDHAKAAVLAYVDEIYSSTAPPVSRSVHDGTHVPSSWKTGSTTAAASAKVDLWEKVVNPYCMSCHRVGQMDFAEYAAFQFLGAPQAGLQTRLKRYLTKDSGDPNRTTLPFMPQAKLEWDNLQADAAAQAAITAWLQVATLP